MRSYYYKDHSDLKPVEDWLIQRYKNGLQKCFQAAIDAGFTTIHILPHVDPIGAADGRGMWRNVVRFDPLAAVKGESSRGYTYEDVRGVARRGAASSGALKLGLLHSDYGLEMCACSGADRMLLSANNSAKPAPGKPPNDPNQRSC